jgi:hypothetical protein
MTTHLQRDNFWPDLHSTTKYDHSLLLFFFFFSAILGVVGDCLQVARLVFVIFHISIFKVEGGGEGLNQAQNNFFHTLFFLPY